MNSPGWTDDSHVLVGMGWISSTIWFIAQSFVEQLHLEGLDMLHVLVCYSLVLSMTGFLCQMSQPRGSLHCEVWKNLCPASTGCVFSSPWYQYMLPTANWLFWQCCLCTRPSPALGQAPEAMGAQLLVSTSALGGAGTPTGHDFCYCPCVSPEVGYAQVQWKLTFYIHALPGISRRSNPPKHDVALISYCCTLKVILSLQIYIFMPFC